MYSTLCTIESITPLGEQDVWDITVEEDHSYAAHGFYNHNSGPNMQQVPRSNASSFHLRKGIVPHKGYILLGGDQSQIELRIMAHNSGDKAMCEEYAKDKERWELSNQGLAIPKGTYKSDIHDKTAKACNATRDESKGINFGLLYGMFAKKLADVLTTAAFDAYMEGRRTSFDPINDVVTVETAQGFRDRFFNTYAGIEAYQNYIFDLIMRQGFVTTRYGRVRRLPDAFSSDKYMRMGACRTGLNHTVQGHVAELMLMCMSRAENIIPNKDGEALQKLGYRMFSQIHDEVQGECPNNRQTIQDCTYHLCRIFQNPGLSTDQYPYSGYRVPLLFEVRAGANWHETH